MCAFSRVLLMVAGVTGLVLVLGATSGPALAQTTPLRLVSTEWPPFTNVKGQPRLALDLVEAALERFNQPSTTTMVEAGQFTSSLLEGKFDGSPAAWKDADRERVLVFSEPYLENRLVLVGRKGADVSATTLAALTGKKVALVEGYSYGEGVDNAGPTYVRARSEEDCLSRLLAGTVDYVLMDDLVVQYLVERHAKQSQDKLQFGSRPLVTRPLYFAVRRSRPDAQAIIDRFNAQLRGMIADRTYHRLLHVDWIQADVDGDGLFEYVPDTDKVSEPKRAYSIFSPPQEATVAAQATDTTTQPRFYVGGNLYRDWASVPDHYKMTGSMPPHPSRSTASLFRFSW